MSKFRHHKYTWSKPFNSVRHSWELVGPDGGVNFHVSVSDRPASWGDSAGLEFHHGRSTGFRCDEAPDHTQCWLTKEACWHDGTSLYASETLWPMIKPMIPDHDAIFRLLEDEYNQRFEGFEIAARARKYGAA